MAYFPILQILIDLLLINLESDISAHIDHWCSWTTVNWRWLNLLQVVFENFKIFSILFFKNIKKIFIFFCTLWLITWLCWPWLILWFHVKSKWHRIYDQVIELNLNIMWCLSDKRTNFNHFCDVQLFIYLVDVNFFLNNQRLTIEYFLMAGVCYWIRYCNLCCKGW